LVLLLHPVLSSVHIRSRIALSFQYWWGLEFMTCTVFLYSLWLDVGVKISEVQNTCTVVLQNHTHQSHPRWNKA
jgi:hypothetical protein